MDLTYGQPSRDRGRDGQRPHDGDEARRRGRVGFRRQLRDAMPPCVASTIHVENRGPRAKVQRARCDRHQVLAGGPSVWRRRTQTLDAVVPAAVFGRYGIVQIEVASDGTGGRILEIGERRLSLRVVRCLPSVTGLRWLERTRRAGVGQASREETAGCPRCGSGSLRGYGDLSARSRATGGDLASRPNRNIARMAGAGAGGPDFSRMHGGRNPVTPARGKAVHYGRWPMKRRRAVWEFTGADDHAAARCEGGARIGCPRTKVSMMSIAAPQCGQTKVGWTRTMGASGG